MNMHPALTNIRSYLSNKFFTLRTDARRDSLWAKLMGKNTELAIFPDQAPEKSPNRKFTGLQDIPIEQIIGTISRHSDFDHKFRPLNKHLRDRWVNVYLTLERDSWSPILAHKVGDHYYVEDGHHRVSVARSIGMAYIEAQVWEYPAQQKHMVTCQRTDCRERSTARVYGTG